MKQKPAGRASAPPKFGPETPAPVGVVQDRGARSAEALSPTTPFIASLIGVTGDPTSPVWHVTSTGVIEASAIRAMPESQGRILEG